MKEYQIPLIKELESRQDQLLCASTDIANAAGADSITNNIIGEISDWSEQ